MKDWLIICEEENGDIYLYKETARNMHEATRKYRKKGLLLCRALPADHVKAALAG